MTCLTHELWSDLSDQLHSFLAGISLQELVSRREVQSVALRQSELQRRRHDDDRERLDLVSVN
jgi:Rrf2 family iron-sulfur cluster assembly transcriptional regulator